MRPPSRIKRGTTKAIPGDARTITRAYEEERITESKIKGGNFTSDPAFATVAFGKTISLGAKSYEFLRIDCSVTLPCDPNEIEATLIDAAEICNERLEDEERAWMGGLSDVVRQPTKRKAQRRS